MYTHKYSKMMATGVTRLLESHEQQDKKENIFDEANAMACKYTHKLTYLYYCLVMDEIGDNISQKDAGYAGCKIYLIEAGMIPRPQSSCNDWHYTLTGMTSLIYLPVIFLVIFSDKLCNHVLELGVDPFAEEEGSQTDATCLTINCVPP